MILERYGLKKTGKETLLGKECDICEMEKYKTKAWVWKGIGLKTTIKSGVGEMTIEAVEFREEPVDPKLFELPQGKVFKD